MWREAWDRTHVRSHASFHSAIELHRLGGSKHSEGFHFGAIFFMFGLSFLRS